MMLQPHETTKYLGGIIGFKVTPFLETEFLLGKVRKRLGHSTNHALNFTGRVVILYHIIKAMPIYHLFLMSLNSQGFKDLETIAHIFYGEKQRRQNQESTGCLK